MNLSDLLTPKTQTQVFEELLTALAGENMPTSSWSTMSVPRRLAWAFAGVVAGLWAIIARAVAGGFLKHATGDWLTLLAESRYQETRAAAKTATGTCIIAAPSGVGPYYIEPGQLWFATDSGLRFFSTNSATLTLTKGGVLDVPVAAEFSGEKYNVSSGNITKLLTPLPGVTYPKHTAVVSSGTSPPTLTVSGDPTGGPWQFQVEFVDQDSVGAPAVFRWRDNPSASWMTSDTGNNASGILLAHGVQIGFPDDGLFNAGTVYTWTSGATSHNPQVGWISAVGQDEQSDDSLKETCKQKWATLGYGQNDDWFKYHVSQEPTYGNVLKRIKVRTDPLGSGAITIHVAKATQGADSTIATAVQNYLQPRVANNTSLTVVGSQEQPLNVVATLYVRATSKASSDAVIAAAKASLLSYVSVLAQDEPAYVTQVAAALSYDDAVIRNVILYGPSADVIPPAFGVVSLGNISLTVEFV